MKKLIALSLIVIICSALSSTANAWPFAKEKWSGQIFADKITLVYEHVGDFDSLGACKKAVTKAVKKRKKSAKENYVCASGCKNKAEFGMRNMCDEVIRVFP